MSEVSVKKVWDGFVAAQSTAESWWKIPSTHAYWFYPLPGVNQSILPQRIQIERVQIEFKEPTVFRAYIKLYNPTAPQPPDFPWKDGVFYDLYRVRTPLA